MVVGNGLLANTFYDYKESREVLIFASGVSNSTEANPLAFERESLLLAETIENYKDYKLIYFSTVSLTDVSVSDRPYVKHKLKLEEYIKKHACSYLILRVSNIVGVKGNPNTIMNYLVSAVKECRSITVWKKAERNIIDTDDVKYIVDSLLQKNITNQIVNVAARESILVTEIVKQIELFFDKKANANYVYLGESLNIDVSKITNELSDLEKKSGAGIDYIANILEKYY